MKKLLIILFAFITTYQATAQLTNWVPYKSKNVLIGLAADSLFYLPIKDTTHIPQRIGAVTIRPQDSLLYKGIKTTAGGKHWELFGGGGGTGSTNTSVGSGFKLAIAGTNNIKSLTAGFGINIDSSTSNQVNIKADTALLVDTSEVIKVDTTGAETGDVAKINKTTNTVYFEPETGGGGSIGYLDFLIGDEFSPTVGDSILTNTYFNGRKTLAWRNGKYLNPNYQAIHIDSTIEFEKPFAAGDTIFVEVRDIIGSINLGLENHAPAGTTIAYVSSAVGDFVSATSSTFSFTTSSGTDRMLIVAFTGETKSGADDITGVTYNGVAMTFGAKLQPSLSGDRWNYMYYLKNPDAGTHNVVISRSTTGYMISTVAEYTGVNTVESTITNTCSCANLTTNYTTVADNCWVVAGITSMGVAITSGYTGLTKRVTSGNYNTLFDTNGAKTPAGAYSFEFTGMSGAQTHVGLILKPY